MAVPDNIRLDVLTGLSSRNAAQRRNCLRQLCTWGPERIKALGNLSVLGELLADQDDEVQVAACDALAAAGELAEPYAEQVVVLLRSPCVAKRVAAVRALGKMGVAGAMHADVLLKLIRAHTERPGKRGSGATALEAPEGEGSTATEATGAQLNLFNKDADPLEVLEVCRAACVALGALGVKEAAEPLAACLAEVDTDLVRAAIAGLSGLGAAGKAHFKAVIEKLSHPNRHVRRAAVGYCAKFPDVAADHADEICDLLADDDHLPRLAVTELFRELGPTKAAPLMDSAVGVLEESEDARCRAAAACCLGYLGPRAKEHAGAIARLLHNTNEDRRPHVFVRAGIEQRLPSSLTIPAWRVHRHAVPEAPETHTRAPRRHEPARARGRGKGGWEDGPGGVTARVLHRHACR
eukprot:NODE_4771_length_1850_cov_2.594893.p1 GENE.NODE_4771_length_1850_cov_2.594893~~NODE_4771_length_1850_cov_2.594893.p1  ORF type:complete len:437 (+),score=119.96 NODE_4771_length_1850_cov_2.594893:88-1311(+)